MNKPSNNNLAKPDFVLALEAAYGPPAQEGFGSAVFYKQLGRGADLEEAAKEQYQYFVGDKWSAWGPDTWLATWKEVYVRQPVSGRNIVQELQGIDDRGVSSSVEMILDVVEDPAAAREALAGSFNAPDMADLRVYQIGDGEALSGLLIAANTENGAALFLVFLMD